MDTNTTAGSYYVVRIRQKLDQAWDEWFDGMTVEHDGEGTVLAGYLPDQAALHGVIARVHRLGLELVAVNQQEPRRSKG